MKKTYNFGEKEKEYDTKTGTELEVWQSPKYIESKAKATEMIESGKYELSEADFWILMNKTKTNKMAYTGLIISHNGCLKINDNIDNKVNSKAFSVEKEGYANSLVYTYVDDEVYEVGEVNDKNCKNDYPYAMAFKRCFDRVVLKKSKLAYSGIYSEVEAEEFRNQNQETTINIKEEIKKYGSKASKLLKEKNKKLSELTEEEQIEVLEKLQNED